MEYQINIYRYIKTEDEEVPMYLLNTM